MSLDVYLHGKRVGGLFRLGEDHYSFAYAPELVAEVGAGKLLLSHSLPLRTQPFGPAVARAYVEGLLPQGGRRRAIARELGLDPSDGYGLIAELGGDCLGAVSFDRGPAETEAAAATGSPAWLTDAELEELLQPRPARLFDESDPWRMRFALPGARHKLALFYDAAEDRWAWPRPGLPSTHIVKPEPPERPGIAANEHACSLAYLELGFPVAHTKVATIAGRPCLLSKRFDRWGDPAAAERLHQESFAQALAICPEEAARRLSPGVPMLSEASELLHAIGEAEAARALMWVSVCDVLLGCTELRGANAALLYGAAGPMLAPFNDIASTEPYGQLRPRPIVIGVDVPTAPLLIDLRHIFELCGAEFQEALIDSIRLMTPLCEALNSAANRAKAEGWHHDAIEDALQILFERGRSLGRELQYLRPPGV